MRLQWNKVTWYSKIAALVVFGAVLATGFYLGRAYEGLCRDRDALSRPAEVAPRAEEALAGHYVSVGGEAEIDVRELGGGTLAVSGLATWHGAGEMVNTGDLDGIAKLGGRIATYQKDDCAVTMTFGDRGRMTAEDNLRCGGLNVSFGGEYRKQ